MKKRSEAEQLPQPTPIEESPHEDRSSSAQPEVPKYGPVLSNDFERIVTSTFVHDAWLTYERLERELEQGSSRTDHGSLVMALDKAETNARAAFKLFMTAKIERVRFEAELEPVMGGMRAAATAALEREKETGARKKTITNDDVTGHIAAMHPDEWKYLQERGAKVKAMEHSMENLSALWASRCFSLKTMLDKSR